MTTIRKSLLSVNKGDSKPYFNAMIAKDMRVDGVVRKMKQLPGVDSIKLIQSSHVKKELEKIKSEFGSDVLDELSTLKSKNLKIFLENGISEKSFTLIKEYMERLVGGNAVTVSSIKKPRRAGMTLGFTKYLNHINFYTLAVLAGLWLSSLILMAKTIHTKFKNFDLKEIKEVLKHNPDCSDLSSIVSKKEIIKKYGNTHDL